jgi:hypothetical protein
MTDRPLPDRPHDDAAWYEIRIGAVFDAHWATWFDGMEMTVLDGRTTRIAGPVADEAALHGYLDRIRDLRLPLLLVRRIPPDAGQPRDRPT